MFSLLFFFTHLSHERHISFWARNWITASKPTRICSSDASIICYLWIRPWYFLRTCTAELALHFCYLLTVLNWLLLRNWAQPPPAPLITEDQLECKGIYFLPNLLISTRNSLINFLFTFLSLFKIRIWILAQSWTICIQLFHFLVLLI